MATTNDLIPALPSRDSEPLLDRIDYALSLLEAYRLVTDVELGRIERRVQRRFRR